MLHAQASEPNLYVCVCQGQSQKGSDSQSLLLVLSKLQTPDRQSAMADTGVETETPLLLFRSIGEGIAAKQIQASVDGVDC